MTEQSEQEKQRNRAPAVPASTAAPGSPSSPGSSSVPKQVVVNNGFDKLFFAFSIPFIVVSLLVVSVSVFFAIFGIPERPGSVPDFVGQLTGEQYELVVRKLGPMDDNLFRSSEAYVLVRTDADVVSNIEQKKVPDFTFVPLESPELGNDRMMGQVDDSTAEIDKVYRELAGTSPGADCRYFVTRDDPEFSTTYLCFSPESKLLLVFRDMKRWSNQEID